MKVDSGIEVRTMAEKKAHSSHHSSTHKSHPHKARKKRKEFQPKSMYVILGVAFLIAIIVIIIAVERDDSTSPGAPPAETVAAIVNGDEIFVSEIEAQYEILPAGYKEQVTKEIVLQQTIEKVLMLQEAEKLGLEVEDAEVDAYVQQFMNQAGFDEGMIEEQLASRGLDMGDIKDLYREQLLMVKLVNTTIVPRIGVTEEEIQEFYELNKDQLGTLEESREQITDLLKARKQPAALQAYVQGLKDDAKITIKKSFEEESKDAPEGLETFKDSGKAICTEDGKPVVYLFSTTWCPHCKWITETYESVVQEYIDAGQIVAYHWELDINDDTLTEEVEGTVPSAHRAIYSEFNPRGSIPTFVFGCRYYRVGNGYEQEGSLEKEEAEFRSIIESMI
jgi:thiol-disulfide isomerase/thioredoxin